jgi:hypothetical protein
MRRTPALLSSAALASLMFALLLLMPGCDSGSDNTSNANASYNGHVPTNTNAHSNSNGTTNTTTPVANVIKNLPEGKLALDAPERMEQGVARNVTARVSLGDPGAKIMEDLHDAKPAETIQVGESMKVTLTSKEQDAFSVRELSEPTQVIVGKPYAEWNWEVKPLKSGSHSLHLSAAVIIAQPGQTEKPFVVPTKDKDIEVEVSYKYVAGEFINRYWNFLFGGISLAGISAGARKAFGWWKRRRDNSQQPPPTT